MNAPFSSLSRWLLEKATAPGHARGPTAGRNRLQQTRNALWAALLVATGVVLSARPVGAQNTDFTIYVTGDPQYWTGEQAKRDDMGVPITKSGAALPAPTARTDIWPNIPSEHCEHFTPGTGPEASITQRAVIQAMNALPGTPGAQGVSRAPLGVLVAGDLTQDGFDHRGDLPDDQFDQVSLFTSQWGLTGADGELRFPVFEGFGNHDTDPDNTTDPVRRLNYCRCKAGDPKCIGFGCHGPCGAVCVLFPPACPVCTAACVSPTLCEIPSRHETDTWCSSVIPPHFAEYTRERGLCDVPSADLVAERNPLRVVRQPDSAGDPDPATVGGITNSAPTGHYSWDWGGVHFVVLNEHAGGTVDGPRRIYARDSLQFLEADLRQHVDRAIDQRVVIMQHFGFDGLSICRPAPPPAGDPTPTPAPAHFPLDGGLPDCIWWSAAERAALIDVMEQYNVVALFTGHVHAAIDSQVDALDPRTGLPAENSRPEAIPTFRSGGARNFEDPGFLEVTFTKTRLDVTRRDVDFSRYDAINAAHAGDPTNFSVRSSPNPNFQVTIPLHACDGLVPTIEGTEFDDVLKGTPGDDIILARGGNDLVRGGGGNDILCGGSGNDRLIGGGGDDLIDGGPGDDRAFGNSGDDELAGGTGDDRLGGGSGDDRLFGGPGADKLRGNSGTDRLDGGEGPDVLYGGSGADVILGSEGGDTLRGRHGDDLLVGGDDDDVLRGGAGSDDCSEGEDTRRCEGPAPTPVPTPLPSPRPTASAAPTPEPTPSPDPADVDGDGVANEVDNCPTVANGTQDPAVCACPCFREADLDAEPARSSPDVCSFGPRAREALLSRASADGDVIYALGAGCASDENDAACDESSYCSANDLCTFQTLDPQEPPTCMGFMDVTGAERRACVALLLGSELAERCP